MSRAALWFTWANVVVCAITGWVTRTKLVDAAFSWACISAGFWLAVAMAHRQVTRAREQAEAAKADAEALMNFASAELGRPAPQRERAN